MDEGMEVTLLDDDEEKSNPQNDQNSTDAGVVYEDNFEAASLELTTELDQNETEQDREDREEEEEMAEITKTTKKQKGTGLDKFKRRLIRAIAHLLRNDQIPTDEIWEDLTKQSGCDCKLLWNRMRTLTMKKLRRLFTAEDKIANITQIAQLTVTDWLLFDLVLVHEKLDVIGQELQDPDAEESPKILEDLFATVVVFDLERLQGDELTKAWFEATTSYNGTERQCSPMLLQRRWYQLKETVREKFYQFWFMYRGSQRQLPAANEFKPTSLEMEIVKIFKYIATQPFPTWEELIQQKKVALPEDFERLQLAKRRIFRTETGPDLEVIEPQVETIDLDQEIDSEESRDSTSTQTPKANINLGKVKIEKVDEISDDDDDVCVLESVLPLETNTNVETETNLRNINEERRSTDINNEEDISIVNDNHSSNDSIQLNRVTTDINENLDLNTQSVDTTEFQDDTGGIVDSREHVEMLMPTIVASTSIANMSNEFDIAMPKILNVSSAASLTAEPLDNALNNEINGILESVADNMSTKNSFNVPQRTDKTLPTLDNIQNPDELVKNIIDEEISSRGKEIEIEDEKGLDSFNEVSTHINIFDGIELEDDGIEYVEEEDLMKEIKPKVEIKTEKTGDNECVSTPTIDLKLLLTPIVYTKKLDDMDVFRFIEYNAVKDKRVIENADNESKPFDRNSVKMEEISQERPPTPDSDAFSDSASEYHSEVDSGPETISPSSWLLNKLPKLSYNPIQLCKNPDFNTRLKRLSAGFFSSERNRRQLKECKPLTIDLHKSFETKLVNNTLYLTGTKSVENKTHGLEENAIATKVCPTTLPLQNLVDNVIKDILGPNVRNEDCEENQNTEKLVPQDDILGPATHLDSSLAKHFAASVDNHSGERNKVINLPDIAQIRRLNEKLLTAEVSPIQVSNITKAPVNIVSVQQRLDIASPNNKILQNNNDLINKNIASTAPSTVSDINCETSSILNKINFASDASCQGDHISYTTHKTMSLESNNNFNMSKESSLKRFNNQQHKVVKEPKKPVRVNRVEVSWNPPPKKCIIPQDRLLTSDTVDKILNICKGDYSWIKKSKAYKKAMRKKSLKDLKQKEKSSILNKEINQCNNEVKMNEAAEITIDSEVMFVSAAVAPTENLNKNTDLNTVPNQTTNEINKKTQGNTMKRVRRENIDKKRLGKPKYCCWAREKVMKLGTQKKYLQKHKCPRPLCTCCCRQELIDKMFEDNIKRDILKRRKAQAETDKTTKLIKISVSSQRQLYENLTQMPQSAKGNSTGKLSKVSIGVNTDFDAEFETSFAANLAEFNTSSKFFDNENPSVSTLKVTYGPDDTQANGQTQTSVNLMVLDKNNKTQIFPGNNSQNASTFSFNESNSCNEIPKTNRTILEKRNSNFSIKESNSCNEISKTNRVILEKRNSNFSFKESNSPNLNPVKIRMVSDINDSAVTLQKTKPIKISNLKPIVLDKNNLNFPFKESNLSAVISNKKSPISSIREWSDARSKAITKQSELNSLLLDKYYPKIAPKTRISHVPGLAPLSVDDKKDEPSDKVVFLSNNRWNNSYSRTPICLGKNKILLCSFENPQSKNQPKLDSNPVTNLSQSVNQSTTCQSTPPEVALPDGVRIILLPNKELALSIDPGIELDSSQLAYLPTLMASIQKQLTAADVVDNITTSSIDELKNKTDSLDQNNITLENRNESDMKSSDEKIQKESLTEVNSLSCPEQMIDHSDVMEVDINKTKEQGCDNKEENNSVLEKSNGSVVDLKDDSDLNKKTILSDLMQMSGISAEDTHHLTNHESPTKQQPVLWSSPITQGLQSQIANQHNEKFINNPLFNNPVVKAALSRCPELCIVFSYTELRYAAENNARFFKMDIESGIVMPINLVIKKQTQGEKSNKQFTISKSVIDLTDDPEEEETISIEEQNAKTMEPEPTAEKVKGRAVPVKLFSVHPPILQRGKSLLVQSVKSNIDSTSNIKKRKMIRIIKVKRKRKEPLECIDLDSDTEQKESPSIVANSEVIPEKTKSGDDSDSDDEPLAFKAKRMKDSTECNEPNEVLSRNTDGLAENLEDNNQSTEMISEFTEIVDENPIDDTPCNITEEACDDQTPRLEPVVFEPVDFGNDMPESSDEDCILGV
ncbi:uncharacterized protein LOC123865520 [Maniola jurtina]|uniref:uncharacterized protein LOC123865520 n=1 Tax=Maniola jurtina TaxID=191418 RepID=UPI001E687ABC|nr:uncharacterized protein LOC123865520 [Maniola jurtina]